MNVDLLDKLDDLFFKDRWIDPVFKPEILDHLNQTGRSDLVDCFFIFLESITSDSQRLFDCIFVYVAVVELFVEFLVSLQKLLVLVDFPLFFPLQVVVKLRK